MNLERKGIIREIRVAPGQGTPKVPDGDWDRDRSLKGHAVTLHHS